MKYLKHIILYVGLSSLFFWIVSLYVPQLGLVVQSEYKDVYVVFLFLGIFSRIFLVGLRAILSLLTLPFHALTFGLSSLVLNFLLLYVFEQFINYLDVGVQLHLGTVVQVFILSCVLALFYFLLKHI